MPWLKVGTEALEGELWRDTLAFRLLLLLRRDAVVTDSPAVRFSYPVACERLVQADPENLARRIAPSRKSVRGALERLATLRLVVIPPPVSYPPTGAQPGHDRGSRRVQGGAQGYFFVNVVGYESYKTTKGGRGTGRGETGALPGTDRGTARVEERRGDRTEAPNGASLLAGASAGSDQKAHPPGSNGSDATPYEELRAAWNEAAARHGLPRVTAVTGQKRRQVLRGFFREAGSDLGRCALAFEAAAVVYERMHREHGGKRYGLFNMAVPGNRLKWIGQAEDPAPPPAAGRWEPPADEVEP